MIASHLADYCAILSEWVNGIHSPPSSLFLPLLVDVSSSREATFKCPHTSNIHYPCYVKVPAVRREVEV